MTGWSLPIFLPLILPAADPGPALPPPSASVVQMTQGTSLTEAPCCPDCCPERGLFESDRAFPNFIGPISNPILSKDPRSLTEARLLYIHNNIDPANPLGSGNFDAFAMEARVAITDRLTLIADKDGYLLFRPRVAAAQADGWLNINAGLKYTLIRDVEDQFLVTAGLMYEPPTGEAKVFQGVGDGVFTVFATSGKEFGDLAHILGTFGYQFPADKAQNSSFIYTSLHLDKQFFGWLYPLVELNWFHYVQGGNHGLPPALGEVDGLINLGTTGVAGNDLVTTAVGLKAMINCHMETGVAWEVPVSNRHDFINNRLTVELILRY